MSRSQTAACTRLFLRGSSELTYYSISVAHNVTSGSDLAPLSYTLLGEKTPSSLWASLMTHANHTEAKSPTITAGRLSLRS